MLNYFYTHLPITYYEFASIGMDNGLKSKYSKSVPKFALSHLFTKWSRANFGTVPHFYIFPPDFSRLLF